MFFWNPATPTINSKRAHHEMGPFLLWCRFMTASSGCLQSLRLPGGHDGRKETVEPVHAQGLGHEDDAIGQSAARIDLLLCQR